MKATILATTFLAATFVHADAKSEDDPAAEGTKVEAVAQARSQIEAAQVQMEAARVQMESARAEMQAAAAQMAEAAGKRLRMAYKERPFLGVLIGDQSEDGIVVAGVTPDGGAEVAGIEADDVIVAVGGESLTGHVRPLDVLHRVLYGFSPAAGDIEVVVTRDGETRSFDVVPAEPTALAAFAYTPLSDVVEPLQIDVLPHAALRHVERLWDGFRRPERTMSAVATGIHFVDIGEDLGDYFGVDGGVLVLNAPGKSELKPGDILRRIDGADVGSADEAYRLLAAASGDDAELEVRRKNRKVDVTVPKGSGWTHHQFYAMPKGKATIVVDGPEIEVDVEVEKDAD